jgi:sugar phosphate isomerase/epimerase
MNKLLICDSCNVGEVAPLCRKYRTGIEVQAFFDPQVLEQFPEILEENKQAVAGITPLAVHGCYADLCPGSFDAMVRGVARDRIEQSYGVAVELGARHLVFHNGYVPHTGSHLDWIRRSTEFWYAFLEGKDHSIKIHLGNFLELEPKLLSDVVRSISRDNMDVNLDIGHANCYSKTSIIDWIEYFGPQLGYVHLYDNNGGENDHLPLGHGTIRLKEVCKALNECAPKATWALEVDGADGIRQSLEWLRDFGFLNF